MITIPSLNDVSDIADSDVVMITNSQGESFKLAGSEINKRGKIIIASSTTVTGAPLKTGSSVRIYFTADLTAANASTTLQLNYNGVNYYVKAPKNGALVNFVATNLGGTPTVYKYLQAYTTLELLFDGTQFVIIGNPVILSSADYTIYADGSTMYSAVSTPILNAKKFFIKREYNDSSSVTVDISSIRLEQYDSFLVVILGAYGYGGLAMAACATNDGTITNRQWITQSNTFCDFSLSNYKNLTITNLAGGILNTLGIMVVKLGN